MQEEQINFENRFDTAIKEVLVLTQDEPRAGRAGEEVLWDAHMNILAYIDVQTGALVKRSTSLTWQLTDAECRTKEKIFDLDEERIYRLKVRESLPYVHFYTHKEVPCGDDLMVVEVLERNCEDDRLAEILTEYQKPVIIHPIGCGELLLDKSMGTFEGDCQWNGEKCKIYLDVDEEGANTAKNAVISLAKLLSDSEIWDDKARKLAASELVEVANDWQQEEDAVEITKEYFVKQLTISSLSISANGNLEIFYDDDDMFLGHEISVRGDIVNGLDSADI